MNMYEHWGEGAPHTGTLACMCWSTTRVAANFGVRMDAERTVDREPRNVGPAIRKVEDKHLVIQKRNDIVFPIVM